MTINQRSGITKEAIGRGYDLIAEKIFVSDEFYSEVLDVAPRFSGDILEIGVGQGVVLEAIAKRGGKNIRSLTGIDLSERLMAMARQKVPAAKIVRGDAESLSFADHSFDMVFMVDTFQYLLDFDKALEEVKRVLRPSGSFLVTVPNKSWILFPGYIAKRKNIQPVDDHFFDFDEAKNLLERHGFKILSYRGADAFRFYGWKHRFERVAAVVIPWMHTHMKKIVFRCTI